MSDDRGIDLLARSEADQLLDLNAPTIFRGIARKILAGMSGFDVAESTGGDFAAMVAEVWKERLLLLRLAGNVSDLSTVHTPTPGGHPSSLGYYIPSAQDSSNPNGDEFELAERNRAVSFKSALPVASDIWYLCAGRTVIPFSRDGLPNELNEAATAEMETHIHDRLSSAYPGVDIMRRVMDASDVNVNSAENRGQASLKEMRFETWGFHTAPEFSCGYPNSLRQYRYDRNGLPIDHSMPEEVVNPALDADSYLLGYLAFPVGPLGVMQSLSLALEVPAPESSPDWHHDDILKTGVGTGGWGGLFPHKVDSDDNRCWGLRVLRSMYIPDGDRTEYPGADFDGFDRHYMHQWLRVYLRSNDTWPVPGTLVFMMARPSPLHCWWYQRSSPFAYAGNFFETRFWSSGIVKKELSDDERNPDEVGQILEVETCGATLYIRCTDFCHYEAGERVSLMKTQDSVSTSFKWYQVSDAKYEEMMDSQTPRPSSMRYVVSETYRVAPVEFYKQEEVGDA